MQLETKELQQALMCACAARLQVAELTTRQEEALAAANTLLAGVSGRRVVDALVCLRQSGLDVGHWPARLPAPPPLPASGPLPGDDDITPVEGRRFAAGAARKPVRGLERKNANSGAADD